MEAHNGRLLVIVAFLVAPASGYLSGKAADYLGFVEFVHNIRRRGRALLGSLLDTLLQPAAGQRSRSHDAACS